MQSGDESPGMVECVYTQVVSGTNYWMVRFGLGVRSVGWGKAAAAVSLHLSVYLSDSMALG
jgi:hypothetical protein